MLIRVKWLKLLSRKINKFICVLDSTLLIPSFPYLNCTPARVFISVLATIFYISVNYIPTARCFCTTKSQLSDKSQFTDLRQRNSSESCSCYSSFIRQNVAFQNAFIMHKSLSNRYNFNLIFTLTNNFCKSTEIFNMKYFKI